MGGPSELSSPSRSRRRAWSVASLSALLGLLPAFGWSLPPSDREIDYQHGYAFVWPLEYAADYPYFDYVNPNAPKGGTLNLMSPGDGYDSFNHFIDKGRDAAGLPTTANDLPELYYDTLLYQSADEREAYYGLLAEGVAVAEDYSWVAFKLRKDAYWHDGEPITVEDVLYTFNTLKKHGSVAVRTAYGHILRAEIIGEREIRFVNAPGGVNNRNTVSLMGEMAILPEHYWSQRDPSEAITKPPLGSGPYRIGDFKRGRYVLYERFDDYWGKDLPVMRGRFNFDRIKFVYYRDASVALQALKAGEIDVMIDTTAKSWTTSYDIPIVEHGLLKKDLVELLRPEGLWWPLFWNLRREPFQDIRVREALWLLYDFRYINRVIMHGYYHHATSFFHGSPMAQRGLPSAAELALLEPFHDILPTRVFTQEYRPPDNNGYGFNRANVEQALELFRAAGWVLREGRLVSEETGEQLEIDFVLISQGLVRATIPYIEALQRVGIETTVRAPESSNWLNRMRQRQFDASAIRFLPTGIPGATLRAQFASAYADVEYSFNWAGVKNPAVDFLISKVIDAEDVESLVAATRALDRVLLWNFYFLPGMASPGVRHVYWDKFGRPEHGRLIRRVYRDLWWLDPDKARGLERRLVQLESGE